MRSLEGSATGAVLSRVARLREEGRDIISLNVGEPDFPTPSNIKAAGIRAIETDHTKYTPGAGLPELREAIAEKLRKENGISCGPENIVVTVGAKQALFAAVMAIAGPGDEVLIPVSYYVSYGEIVRMAGAVPVFVDTVPDTFDLDLEALERAVTPRTRAVILCTPGNPTGRVFGEDALRSLAGLALSHDFFLLVDEIYEKIVFDGARHFSIASISEEVRDHTITVNGFSKTYAMTGWRIGYAAAGKEIADAILKIVSQDTTCVSSISQQAALEALRGSQRPVAAMVREFALRRDFLLRRLEAMPEIGCPEVQGAFYLFLDVRAYYGRSLEKWTIRDERDLADYLLEEGGIAVVSGSAYGKGGYIRISYAASMQSLRIAMDRMEEALGRLKE